MSTHYGYNQSSLIVGGRRVGCALSSEDVCFEPIFWHFNETTTTKIIIKGIGKASESTCRIPLSEFHFLEWLKVFIGQEKVHVRQSYLEIGTYWKVKRYLNFYQCVIISFVFLLLNWFIVYSWNCASKKHFASNLKMLTRHAITPFGNSSVVLRNCLTFILK